ncbi:Uncharacterised protein [Chlamydia trachomatis]|nr:Uncharacterised protein [Chlamydia trachomatis]
MVVEEDDDRLSGTPLVAETEFERDIKFDVGGSE